MKSTPTNGAIFIRLLREFEQAHEAKVMMGAQPADEHAQIKAAYNNVKAALMNHVCNNIKD